MYIFYFTVISMFVLGKAVVTTQPLQIFSKPNHSVILWVFVLRLADDLHRIKLSSLLYTDSYITCLLFVRNAVGNFVEYVDRVWTNVISYLYLVTAKDKGEKKLFGFAFTPLMRDDGTTLSDDIHELYVYKVPGLLNCSPQLQFKSNCHCVLIFSHIKKIKEFEFMWLGMETSCCRYNSFFSSDADDLSFINYDYLKFKHTSLQAVGSFTAHTITVY